MMDGGVFPHKSSIKCAFDRCVSGGSHAPLVCKDAGRQAGRGLFCGEYGAQGGIWGTKDSIQLGSLRTWLLAKATGT